MTYVEEPFPESILCLECATILTSSQDTETVCKACNYVTQHDSYRRLHDFSLDALRYGHQYKEYYSRQKEQGNLGQIKACLADLDIVFKFLSIAAISGIVGGASWDATKAAISKILKQYENSLGAIDDIRVEPTIDEDRLDSLIKDVLGYYHNLSHLDPDIVPLVVEEMFADSGLEHIEELNEIFKLMSAEKKAAKKQKRARKLQKKLLKKIIEKKLGEKDHLDSVTPWSKVER